MSEVQGGAAYIDLKARDNTAPAFKSVNEHFKDFKDNLKNVEDNLKPFQEFLKGGLTLGGVGTGISAAINDTNSLAVAFDNSRSSLEKLNAVMDTSVPTKMFSIITAVSGSILGAISTIKQLAIAWKAARTIGVAFNAAVYAQVAATKAKTAATATDSAASSANNAIQASKAALMAATTTVIVSNSGVEMVNTATKEANTVATVANTIAMSNQEWVTGALTVATNYLTAAMGLNPFIAWAVAITATIALIWGAITAIKNLCNTSKELAEQAENNADKTRKFREALSETYAANDKQLERLEQLKNKQNKTAQEMEEARQLMNKLKAEYRDLSISIDGNTISIDKNVASQIKAQQAKKKLNSLELEYKRLEKALENTDDPEKRKELYNKKYQVAIERDYYKSGGMEDVTGKSEKEILQMRIDAEKKRIEETKKRQEELKQAEEKRQAFAEKGLKLQADMEKTIRQETMSALEKELEAVDDLTKARREELELAKKKGEITEENYKKEITALDELEKKRKDQIKAKYEKQAGEFYLSFREKLDKENRGKANKEEEKSLNQAIETNPFEALKTIQGKLTTANSAYNNADRQWQDAVIAAKSDGVISKEEEQQIAKLEQVRAEAMARVERMQGLKESAQGKANERVEKAYNQALEKARKSREVNPVETLMKGSVEAYKKELENANRGRTVDPTVVKLEELKKQMEKEAREKAEREKKTSDYVKKICESVGAV